MSDAKQAQAILCDSQISNLLEERNTYIVSMARRKIPTTNVHPALLGLEIDELAQKMRIKFWKALRKARISKVSAYLNCIGYTEQVTMARSCKPVYPLAVNEEGEVFSGSVLIHASEGSLDPAIEFERAEDARLRLEQTVTAVLTLPPCQQRAVICMLKEQLAGLLPVAEAFRRQGLDIDAINWPANKRECMRLKASLSEARKKLADLLNVECRYATNC